jgi:hypothetical protein
MKVKKQKSKSKIYPWVVPPLCGAERGRRGEFQEKFFKP